MGHTLLGVLPKTRRWKEVVELLDDSPQLTGALAAAIADAAERRLARLKSDESLEYAFWLLVRIASAASGGNFAEELTHLGLRASASMSMLGFISDISDKVRDRTTAYVESGDFAEISSLSLRSALLYTVAAQGRSLFGSTLEDVQAALRVYSTPQRFSVVAERFFAHFFSKTLRSALEREIASHIGPDASIASIAESAEFSQALSLYASQVAKVIPEFAAGWYSLHNWRSNHRITPGEAHGFVAHALDKLRAELSEGRML